MECPACQADILKDQNFCARCGAQLRTVCASCGHSNSSSSRFCGGCGANLTGGVATSTEAELRRLFHDRAGALRSAERRQLTVMFCDLVGSTALSAVLDPEDLHEIIGAYHRCCASIVGHFGGFVAKYMGDGILAYFGYPHALEDDAERSIRAALAVAEAVGNLRARSPLKVRIGIATGLVVVGDLIGEGVAQEHGVVGQTPNLAARLQAAANPGEIVIASGTRRLTGGSFVYESLGALSLKGFPTPIEAFRVLHESASGTRFEAQHERGLSPLVGREEEHQLITRRWNIARSGQGQIILLVGEPGIGKSHLARIATERLSTEAHCATLSCSSYHQDSPFHPIIEHLKQSAGWRADESIERNSLKLTNYLARYLSNPEQIALVAELLAVATERHHLPPAWTPEVRKEKTIEAVAALLFGLVSSRPLLLLVEDIHWMDPTSHELLALLIAQAAKLRAMLVVTARQSADFHWAGLSHVTTIQLTRLTPTHSAALVAQVAEGKTLPEEVVEQILARTDGVPLFVEELTKNVLESDLLRKHFGPNARDAPIASVSIPTTLHASLLARLDRMEGARRIAQIAAAVGREFSGEILRALMPDGGEALSAALSQLETAELIFQKDSSGRIIYTFKHALVQEIAYDTLLRKQRQELHAQIARILEFRFADTKAQQPELLAHHYTEGNLSEQAIEWWMKAARKAANQSAMIEATAHLQRGLELLAAVPDSPDRSRQELEFQSALGAVLVATKGAAATETGEAYGRARQLCELIGDVESWVLVLGGQSSHHLQRREYGIMGQIGDDLLRSGERRNDVTSCVVGHRVKGICAHQRGEFAEARQHFERILALYEPEQHRSIASIAAYDVKTVALSYLSWDLFILGYSTQALQHSHESLAWCTEIRHPHSLGFALGSAAVFNLLLGDADKTLELLDRGTILAAEFKYPYWPAMSKVMRGRVLVSRKHIAEGLSLARSGFAELTRTGAIVNQTYFLSLLAQTCQEAGKSAEALDLLENGLEIVRSTGEAWMEAELHRFKGEWLRTKSPVNHEEAEACFRRAIEVAKRQNAKMWEVRAVTGLGRLWQAQKRVMDAEKLISDVYSWFGEGFDVEDLQDAKDLLRILERSHSAA